MDEVRMSGPAQQMLNCIRYEVCGQSDPIVVPEDSVRFWSNLYQLSKSHDLAHLVGDALIKNGLLPDEEIKSKFEKQLMMAVYRYERINYELNSVRKALNKAEIPFIPLKGSVLRQYYPEPWMRTSCDIDILIHECDLERAVALLTSELSYRKEIKGSHDVSLFSQSGVHLELHYSLIEEKSIGQVDSVLQTVWENASPIDGTSEYLLSDEMFYYYHIAHMAKHFVGGGCGIRPFLDIWVLNHCKNADSGKRDALLAAGGLDSFAASAERLSQVWFDGAEHTDLTKQMEQYLLSGGVYGTTENRVSVQQVRKGGKFRYALSRIWLPYDVLKFQYPSLDGKRLLLPFYEVRRWFRLLFRGNVKRSVHELKVNSTTTKDEQDAAKRMLSELRLT